jgi:hypothetical protein
LDANPDHGEIVFPGLKTFFVLKEIFVESELIIGGKERTVPLAS